MAEGLRRDDTPLLFGRGRRGGVFRRTPEGGFESTVQLDPSRPIFPKQTDTGGFTEDVSRLPEAAPDPTAAALSPASFKSVREYAAAEDNLLRATNEEEGRKREFFFSEGAKANIPFAEIEEKLKQQGVDKWKPYQTPKGLLDLITAPTEKERLATVEGTAAAKARGTATVAKPATAAERRVDEAKVQAQADIEATGGPAAPALTVAPEVAALGGTGPFRKIAAAADAVLGGLGIIEDVAPDTQENRQVLRTLRQVGKAALLNSSRGAIWEQKNVNVLFPNPDTFWTNPRTEANKIQVLRDTVATEKNHNNQAILKAVSQKEIDKLRQSNVEIDNLLELIGPGQEAAPPVEGARKAPDGNWYVPNPDIEGGWMRVD